MITSKTAPEVLKLALPHVARIKAARAEYEREKQEAGGWLDYCRHGNYIGTWWGPDYLCGFCEESHPAEVYNLAMWAAYAELSEIENRRKRIDMLYGFLIKHPQARTFINAELSRRAY